ncbi:MAG: hypothetical protein PVJ43_09425 [Gemmatimonadales bacterium]
MLRGKGERLGDFDIVIVESSFIATLQGTPEFPEVVQHMAENGWVPYDIVRISRRPLDEALAQVDVAFIPADSPTQGRSELDRSELTVAWRRLRRSGIGCPGAEDDVCSDRQRQSEGAGVLAVCPSESLGSCNV